MKDLPDILTCLEKTPAIFNNLAGSIPVELRKRRRIKGAWTIHEHVCHLTRVQPMLTSRFQMFREEEHPVIRPFQPGKTDSEDNLMAMDWDLALADFPSLRQEMLQIINQFDGRVWSKEASHPEYKRYTPYILARHVLMHDHWHMYRIEELWLTTDEYLAVDA